MEKGQWTTTVSGNWRITFAFDGEDVEYVRHGAPVLDLDAVRHAAQVDLLDRKSTRLNSSHRT